MRIGCADDGFFYGIEPPPQRNPKRKDDKRARIENHDGNKIYVAETISIEIEVEEVDMKIQPNAPLSFSGALKLAGATLLITGTAMWYAYDQVQGQISEVRSEVSSLRSDNREDFNRINDRMDSIANKLDAKIDAIGDKTDNKLDKLTDILNDIRRDQPKEQKN
ncbi:Uncharacterised protein [Yersinia nurmii]|uniref:Uncharacterized protein n=1 Tax=Yersinia nurmii TaxID=685706 RepID=A0ABP1YJY7_9GAMM|nr:hypothetical protein [Yersinia nurmii]CNF30432.1 Uncharacterised protein [Yersinia nurmii]